MNDGIPLLLGHTHEQGVACDTGIVHQDIEAAEVGNHLLNHLMRCLKICGIGSVELHLYAQGCYLIARGLCGFVEFEIRERDIGSLAGISQSYLFAYSTSCPRDKGCFIL